MQHEFILILDFGGRSSEQIARRVRECNVYCEVKPCSVSIEEIRQKNPKGIILTDGASAVSSNAPKCDPQIFELGVPVLGIGYGMQLMCRMLAGQVDDAKTQVDGIVEVTVDQKSTLFADWDANATAWASNTYNVAQLPQGFSVVASANACPVMAVENAEKGFYGVQFHPEVSQTPHGEKLLQHFLHKLCGCRGDWDMANLAKQSIAQLREQIGDKKVLCALSGGVDSSVCAVLIHQAVGKQLTCIFVDHGLLRKDEGDQVEEVFTKQYDVNLVRVNAQERFLNALSGVTDPETKRKIIGEEFIRVFEEEAKKIGAVDFLVQGTIYPDVIESGVGDGAVIKSHHNVGGLPDHVDFKEIIEPLRYLFKDEVRQLGIELGIPHNLVWRQPFPGPGLGVRVIGEITEQKLSILREADAIFREEIVNAGLEKECSQYFAVITNMRSVGVTGDERTYDYTIALRAISTTNFMTADWSRIPFDVLERASSRIANEVKHVNRIVYDITSKPPATIEWE